MSDESKKAILDLMETSSAKGKKKLYPNDLTRALEQLPRAEVKMAIQELLDAGDLCYWSSGSTTYVMLKKDFEEIKEGE